MHTEETSRERNNRFTGYLQDFLNDVDNVSYRRIIRWNVGPTGMNNDGVLVIRPMYLINTLFCCEKDAD